ncbi:hypothetical protein IEC97_05470 [Neobacillus cucumis]|uniref:hypothetical protein n=1 Tax=Neobacillus cucumis TaxID=1740721 RepID=UPI0018DFD994|nr:hypothetical protein [Neobacillus cucumis]MBI0576799.1 hypothetical protein [Neobacillus cucumis]
MNVELDEILSACKHILSVVKDKLKEDVNPILIRIQYIIKEFQTHLAATASTMNNPQQEKYHWSVVYRAGDTLDEMATLIKNTTPVLIKTEVDYIKQRLVFFTNHVVQTFGNRESLYIITPKFQELSGLW